MPKDKASYLGVDMLPSYLVVFADCTSPKISQRAVKLVVAASRLSPATAMLSAAPSSDLSHFLQCEPSTLDGVDLARSQI